LIRKLISFLGSLLALVTGAGLLARFLPPDIWWPPSIIALLLPGLLFLTLIFFLFCLYRKWLKAAIFPGLILIAALPITTRLFSFSSGKASAASQKTATIITTNVRGYKNDLWENVDSELAFRFLRARKPDALLLQETRNNRHKEPYFDKIKAISELEKRHQPKIKTIATYADQPTFIADKFPKRTSFNGFLVTDVETKLGTIRIINAHLQSNQISGT